MPLADYKCDVCQGQQTDVLVKATDAAPPLCCNQPMTKQWSTTNAAFKGKGFHAVDYRAPTRGY